MCIGTLEWLVGNGVEAPSRGLQVALMRDAMQRSLHVAFRLLLSGCDQGCIGEPTPPRAIDSHHLLACALHLRSELTGVVDDTRGDVVQLSLTPLVARRQVALLGSLRRSRLPHTPCPLRLIHTAIVVDASDGVKSTPNPPVLSNFLEHLLPLRRHLLCMCFPVHPTEQVIASLRLLKNGATSVAGRWCFLAG